MDFQLKTKQRISSYKKIKEKEQRSPEKHQNNLKNSNQQDIPTFLEKTKQRLASHSTFSKKEKVIEKKKLKEKMIKLEDLKKKAIDEISKLPTKSFQPKEKFILDYGETSPLKDDDEQDPFDEIQIEETELLQESLKKDETLNDPLNEIKGPEFFESKDGKKTKLTQNKKKFETHSNQKENIDKNLNVANKNIKIFENNYVSEQPKKSTKSVGKYINNTKFLILEREIRQKEKEILEFEKCMKNQKEATGKNHPKNDEKLLGHLQEFEEEQRIFFQKIHDKIDRDLNDGNRFKMAFRGDDPENEDNFDHKEEKTKKIKDFLKSEKKGEPQSTKPSPFDHLMLVNEIIEKNQRKKEKEKDINEKNCVELDFLSLDDFEKDIYIFKNLYSKGNEGKQIIEENHIIESEMQNKLFDDDFLLKPWK